MYFTWRESSALVNLDIECTRKAAITIHGIFYRNRSLNQVSGMKFIWNDRARQGEDEILLELDCDTATAKRIMAVYHQYKGLAPAAPKYPCGVHECLAYPDPGNKIGAIKMIREVTGMGLKEAKDFSERISFHLGEEEVQSLTEKGFTLRLITSR